MPRHHLSLLLLVGWSSPPLVGPRRFPWRSTLDPPLVRSPFPLPRPRIFRTTRFGGSGGGDRRRRRWGGWAAGGGRTRRRRRTTSCSRRWGTGRAPPCTGRSTTPSTRSSPSSAWISIVATVTWFVHKLSLALCCSLVDCGICSLVDGVIG